ncbi:hypothetical protein [Dongshaea marina]|uniref:hypothetical protein n=1 Tax=Dongshaea marina TaxID=2047966 RepID=UPI00131EE892|nr:hypothetical protein [Dongshaea marina]
MDKIAYEEGIRVCYEGGDRDEIYKLYHNPTDEEIRAFHHGFDDENAAEEEGNSLY